MNIAKLILGNLSEVRCNPKAIKELIRIVYAVINNQNGNKLPDISEDLQGMIYSVVVGDYFAELLENWSRDYDNTRQQPQRPTNFANDIHSKILQGIGKETGGKV